MLKSAFKKQRHLTIHLAAASVLTLLLASCQSEQANETELYGVLPEQTKNAVANGPQQAYHEENRGGDGDDDGQQGAEKPDSPDLHATAEASSHSEHPRGNGNRAVTDWNADKPSLAGIAIGAGESAVEQALGPQHDNYFLADEQLNVLEYDGLAVGVDWDGNVRFIEIFHDQISAGLNGLRIGHGPDKALQYIGPPATQTDYVMTYEAAGATLKLDIDPASDAIVSIRLFATNL